MIYTPDMTLGEARKIYFDRSGFGPDGGYDDVWIRIKVWKIPILLPNTKGRVAAVKLHDLHHILTEYATTWRGETEISAWEIGSGGLHSYWAGWLLDLWSMAIGLVINPVGVYHAFMRGRKTRNLFGTVFDEGMLDSLVGEYRHGLKLESTVPEPKAPDIFSFAFWAAISALVYLGSALMPIAALLALGYLTFWR